MIKELEIKEENTLDTNNFLRIGDLWYFEGPLLSLFIDQFTNSFYLVDWVDHDSKYNRWIIYSVSPEYLQNFIDKKISHFELFEARYEQEVFVVDIDPLKNSIKNCTPKKICKFPEIYYPSKKNYFDELDTRLYKEIKSTIKAHLKENIKDSITPNYFNLEISCTGNFYTSNQSLNNVYHNIHLRNTNTKYNNIKHNLTQLFCDSLEKRLIPKEYENQYN